MTRDTTKSGAPDAAPAGDIPPGQDTKSSHINERQMRPCLLPGDPLPTRRLWCASPIERVMYRTVLQPSGCWEWLGTRNGKGYGKIRLGTGLPMAYTHRVVYEALVGPIPEGLILDHVVARGCTSTACCNPAHLEPVTQAVNLARGKGNQYVARDRCAHGHRFTKANTYLQRKGAKVWRRCRTCRRIASRNRRAVA